MFDWVELTNWEEYTKLFIGLLALTDPLGNLPIFQSLTSHFDPEKRKRVANIAVGVYVITLLFFTFLGDSLLGFFGISIHGFRVAGGVLLLLMGLEMMRGSADEPQDQSAPARDIKVAIVPLAAPLLAGPGAISAVIIYGQIHQSLSHLLVVSGVILAVSVVAWLVLRSASVVEAAIGKMGMEVFRRIMGLIVTAIGVEFVLDGVAMHFPELFHFTGH